MTNQGTNDFLTDDERAAGGIDHGDLPATAAPAEAAPELVATQADQYGSSTPAMRKTVIADNPPPHDDLSTEDDGALLDDEAQ